MKNNKKFLKEDLAGAGYYGPHGYMVYGDMGGLLKSFAEPFKDLFGVVRGESEKLFSAAKMSFKVAVGALANMIPGIKTDFDAIFNERSEEVQEIKKEYKTFYDNIDKIFGENKDLGYLTFMWNPALVMSGKLGGAAGSKISDFFKKSTEKNEIFDRWSTLVNENSQLVPDDLRQSSASYKEHVKSTIDNIQKKVEEVLKMPEMQFIEKYASVLGNEKKLYQNIQKQIQKAKAEKDVNPEQIQKVVDQLTAKLTDIVKIAKNKYRDTYVDMLNSIANDSETAVESFNKEFSLSVSPTQHGLSPFLRDVADKLTKLKVE